MPASLSIAFALHMRPVQQSTQAAPPAEERSSFSWSRFLPPYFPGQPEHRPALGPTHIHRGMGDDGGDLLLRHAVGLGVAQMIGQG